MIVLMAAQQCEWMEYSRAVHLKMVKTVIIMLCVFYHN